MIVFAFYDLDKAFLTPIDSRDHAEIDLYSPLLSPSMELDSISHAVVNVRR